MTFWAFVWYSRTTMGFEVDIDAPGWLVYFFSHSAERLIIEGLTPCADIIHGCLADGGLSFFIVSDGVCGEDSPSCFFDLYRSRLYPNEEAYIKINGKGK
jgi:hypothetical protein